MSLYRLYTAGALGMSLILTVALGMLVSSGIYLADQMTRDDAKRFLLLEANQALKLILNYQSATLKKTNFKDLNTGSISIPGPLSILLENTFQNINPSNCELYLTTPSAFQSIYIDPNQPENQNHPFAGQTLSQTTYTLCAKVKAQQANNGPEMTLYGKIPITQIDFSYFNFTAFFDMDLDLSFNNFLTVTPLIYANGSIWSTCRVNLDSTGSMCTGNFRQAQPSLFSNTSQLNSLYTSNIMTLDVMSGAASFNTYTYNYPYNTYNSLTNQQVDPDSNLNETDFYDSLTTNASSGNNPNIKSWDDFLDNYHINFATHINPFPIDGFSHYIPSSPRVSSIDHGRNSKNYAWALLEPPFGEGSYWCKGKGEKNKFSYNSCAVIKVITTPAQNIDPTWGMPIVSTNSQRICSAFIVNPGRGVNQSSTDKCPIPTPTNYDVHFLSFARENNNDPFSPLTTNNYGSATLNPFGNHQGSNLVSEFVGSSLTINANTSPNAFALMVPYKIENNTILSSFYDLRRQCGIDALIIDVEKLYIQLTTSSNDYPTYDPNKQYNGIVYIEFPESKFNNMPQDGSAGTVCPPTDSNYVRTENNTPVAWGVVLKNEQNIPYNDTLGKKGFTIASNVPIYLYPENTNPVTINNSGASNVPMTCIPLYGNGNGPCMIAADAVTLLSPSFFKKSTVDPNILYHSETTLTRPNSISWTPVLFTSILTGITAYWPTGNWNGIGDNLSTSLRLIEDLSRTSQISNIIGTTFGLTEPQCACGPLKNCNPPNLLKFLYPGSTALPCVYNDPKNFVPPGCDFLKSSYYREGACVFITEDDFNALKF